MHDKVVLSGVLTAEFERPISGFFSWLVEDIVSRLRSRFKLVKSENNVFTFSEGLISFIQMASMDEPRELSLTFRDVTSSKFIDYAIENLLQYSSSLTTHCTIKTESIEPALSKLYVNSLKFSQLQSSKTYWFQVNFMKVNFEISVYRERSTFFVSFKVDKSNYREGLFTSFLKEMELLREEGQEKYKLLSKIIRKIKGE